MGRRLDSLTLEGSYLQSIIDWDGTVWGLDQHQLLTHVPFTLCFNLQQVNSKHQQMEDYQINQLDLSYGG
jgi:hypothetical protein